MIKKAFILTGAVVLLSMLFFGSQAFSVVGTAISSVQDRVGDNLSPQFKLQHARRQIAKLGPEISRHKRQLAKEEVDVEKLENQIKALEQKVAKAEGDILRLKSDLDTGAESYTYDAVYTRDEVKVELKNRFDDFQSQQETLQNLKAALTVRMDGLEAARDKIRAMQKAQNQLALKVDALEARMKVVEVAKASTQFEFDESRLASTRDIVEDLEGRVRAEEKLVRVDPKLRNRIDLDGDVEAQDITEKVADYFSKKGEKEEAGEFVKVAE